MRLTIKRITSTCCQVAVTLATMQRVTPKSLHAPGLQINSPPLSSITELHLTTFSCPFVLQSVAFCTSFSTFLLCGCGKESLSIYFCCSFCLCFSFDRYPFLVSMIAPGLEGQLSSSIGSCVRTKYVTHSVPKEVI